MYCVMQTVISRIYFLRVSCLETGSAEGQRLKGYKSKGYTLNFSLFVAEIIAL